MTFVVSIRRASLEDVETLVDLRLALERESGHLTQEAMLADVRRATRQYFLEALPAEAILVWVAEADGTIVASSGLIFFQKPPSERNLTGLEEIPLDRRFRSAYAKRVRTFGCFRKKRVPIL